MASSTPFDGTNFLTGAPDVDQPHGNDYQEHQSTRKSMEFVNNKEHTAIGNDPSAANAGGEHKNGSSVVYYTGTDPTLRPDGATALADNDVDKGRVWFDTTFDPPVMKKWNGSAWVQAGNKVLNDTFYTGVDQAGTGSVDLIKAGRNVANDTNVPFIPDKARLATTAAPIEDTDIVNKKYVDFSELTQQDADSANITDGVTYTATSDGFFSANVTLGGVGNLIISVGGTQIFNGRGSSGFPVSGMVSVAKGETFSVAATSPSSEIYRWRSTGTLSKPTK